MGSVPSLFLARKPQQRLRMILQREYFPSHHSSLRPHRCPAGSGREGLGSTPSPGSCGDLGQRRAAAGGCSPGWTGCHGAHAVTVPHAPSRGFWRGAGSSGHIRSDVGDSARSRDGFPPPPAHHNCCSPPPIRNPPSTTAQAEAKAESVLLSHFGG